MQMKKEREKTLIETNKIRVEEEEEASNEAIISSPKQQALAQITQIEAQGITRTSTILEEAQRTTRTEIDRPAMATPPQPWRATTTFKKMKRKSFTLSEIDQTATADKCMGDVTQVPILEKEKINLIMAVTVDGSNCHDVKNQIEKPKSEYEKIKEAQLVRRREAISALEITTNYTSDSILEMSTQHNVDIEFLLTDIYEFKMHMSYKDLASKSIWEGKSRLSRELFYNKYVKNTDERFIVQYKILKQFENSLRKYQLLWNGNDAGFDISNDGRVMVEATGKDDTDNQKLNTANDCHQIFNYLLIQYDDCFIEMMREIKSTLIDPCNTYIKNQLLTQNLKPAEEVNQAYLTNDTDYFTDYTSLLPKSDWQTVNNTIVDYLTKVNIFLMNHIKDISEKSRLRKEQLAFEKGRKLEVEKIEERERLEREKEKEIAEAKRLREIEEKAMEEAGSVDEQGERFKAMMKQGYEMLERIKIKKANYEAKLAEKHRLEEERRQLNIRNKAQFEADLAEKKLKVYREGWLQAYCYKYLICKIEKNSLTFKCNLKISFNEDLFTSAAGGRTMDVLKGHTIAGSDSFKIVARPDYPTFKKYEDILDGELENSNGQGLYEAMLLRSEQFLIKFQEKFCRTNKKFTLHKFCANYRRFIYYGLEGIRILDIDGEYGPPGRRYDAGEYRLNNCEGSSSDTTSVIVKDYDFDQFI